MTRHLRRRYGRASSNMRSFSVEIRWAGYPTEYEIVHAKTDDGAEKAAMYAGMRLAAKLHRGRPGRIVVHADAGTKAEHVMRLRGSR